MSSPRIILIFLFFAIGRSAAQNPAIDSLEAVLKTCGDSEKVYVMSRLVGEYSTVNPQKAAEICEQEFALAKKLNIPSLLVIANVSQSTIFTTQSNLDAALEKGLEALNMAEKLKDANLRAISLNCIGFVYQKLRDHKSAMTFLWRALAFKDQISDGRILGNVLNNLGNSLYNQKQYDSAMYYFEEALKVRSAIGDLRGVSYCYNNMGNVLIEKKNSGKALEYYLKSLRIKEQIGERKGVASAHINIAAVYLELKSFDQAIEYAERGIKYASDIGAKDFLIDAYQTAAEAYKGAGNYSKSTQCLEKLIAVKDSVFNANTFSKIAEIQTKHETDKQQQQLELQRAQLDSQDAKIGKQNIMIIGAIVGLVLLIGFVIMFYRNYSQKRITSEKLAETNLIIERKNKDITDSIKYALRIQKAILPERTIISNTIPESFIYYNPRDIVSGDFYWFHRAGDVMIIASADCTGHGVPGAFMSMICVQLLNQVITDSNITAPEQALQALDVGVKKALQQKGLDATTDGMDIAIAAIHLNKKKIQFAGAFRPLYVYRDNRLIEYAANKFTIGGYVDRDKVFRGHEIKYQEGDCIYLFTDGFADQFGGASGKKFMLRNFKNLLTRIGSKSLKEQSSILEETFQSWKGQFEQVDDILVMGLRV